MNKTIDSLITDHIDTWTSAIKQKSATGRGSNKKYQLYGIKKLRELILELAVRGKLVPQDPNDEPASVLLERVAKYKLNLVKEKKLKKQKILPTLKEAGVSITSLPLGWTWAFMPQIIANDNYAIKRGPFGSALKKAYFVNDGYKVYEQQHAINDDFSRGEYYVDETKFNELKAFEVKPHDLIISCSGTIGKVAIAPKNMKRGIINQALLKISLNTEALTNDYFKILFPAFFMQTETLTDLQGTAQKNMVSVDTLRKEPFPYPPIQEQHRIVAKVDELMLLCDQLEQQTELSINTHKTLVEVLLNSLTTSKNAQELNRNWARVSEFFDTLFTTEHSIDQLKQTILQLAVMGKLVPQEPSDEPASKLLARIATEKAQLISDKKIKKQKVLPPITEEEKLFELPSGWEVQRLENICQLITKGSSPKWQGVEYTENPMDILFVTSENVGSFNLLLNKKKYVEKKFNEIEPRSILERGDFLMNIVGASIGRTAVFDIDEVANINQAVCLIRSFPQKIHSAFFLLFFNSATCISYMYDKQVENARPNLSMANISKFIIPIPPFKEQVRIANKVDELFAICDQLKSNLNQAQQTQLDLTDAIIEKAVSS